MIYPIQPYFAFSADKYYKRPLTDDGIVHIYEYACLEAEGNQLMVIPDGCMDVIFDMTDHGMKARVAGTVLAGTKVPMNQGHTYFGIRFEPGILPVFLNGTFQDYIDQNIDLADCTRDVDLAQRICELGSFEERSDYFVKYYRGIIYSNEQREACRDKEMLFAAVRDRIEESGGKVMIRDLEDYTGYSPRYIGKVFQEYAGMSPKMFARIIRFQNAINLLDHDNDISFTELAINTGYYDQPQFIRDFKTFAGTTPKEYRRRIIESNYMHKFVLA